MYFTLIEIETIIQVQVLLYGNFLYQLRNACYVTTNDAPEKTMVPSREF